MRILYIDIDSLRPDHLGCYGYHRATSPNIDRIAAQGVRFASTYASDTPCLPSRTALFSGRFGIHTGVVDHGGSGAELVPEGPERTFNNLIGKTGWMRCFRDLGAHTATISPFAERHGAYHFYANFNEVINTGKRGLERADDIGVRAIEWLRKSGARDRWFLHVNLWDPHTPYRTPAAHGDPFADEPLPAWYTESVQRGHLRTPGPHSAREPNGFDTDNAHVYRPAYPRHPLTMDSMAKARMMFDGYDTGIHYADVWVGRILDELRDQGLLDSCAILISADHGENLGELGVYADHQTADQHTARVPVILRFPGVTDHLAGQLDNRLYYQLDIAASLVDMCGGQVPSVWDGVSFASDILAGASSAGAGSARASSNRPVSGGRSALVLSQGAWTCQRAVRFVRDGQNFLYIRTYHDGFRGYPDALLFNLDDDPHEERDLVAERPDLAGFASAYLEGWLDRMMRTARHSVDPLQAVIDEGGPAYTRGKLPAYVQRLRATGRADWADKLARKHSLR